MCYIKIIMKNKLTGKWILSNSKLLCFGLFCDNTSTDCHIRWIKDPHSIYYGNDYGIANGSGLSHIKIFDSREELYKFLYLTRPDLFNLTH